jgi:hypothetical protein
MPKKIIKKFQDQYGKKKGKQIFHATAKAQGRDPHTFEKEDVETLTEMPHMDTPGGDLDVGIELMDKMEFIKFLEDFFSGRPVRSAHEERTVQLDTYEDKVEMYERIKEDFIFLPMAHKKYGIEPNEILGMIKKIAGIKEPVAIQEDVMVEVDGVMTVIPSGTLVEVVTNTSHPMRFDRFSSAGMNDLPTKVWPDKDDITKGRVEEMEDDMLDDYVDEIPKEPNTDFVGGTPRTKRNFDSATTTPVTKPQINRGPG